MENYQTSNILFLEFSHSEFFQLYLPINAILLLLLLLYGYCIYAFLANCRKGACGYVQCWKSSVLSSFLNTEKVMLGSFILGGREFQAVGPA